MTNAKYKIIQIGEQRSIVEVQMPKLSTISKIKNYFFKKQMEPAYVTIGQPHIINNNDLMTLDEMGFVI